MTSAIAIGSGPIAFTTKDGRALLIPLTAITFENDIPKLSDAYSKDATELQPWLKYLAKQEIIKAGKVAPPQSLIITATDPGIAGNSIQIDFTPNPADASKLKATVTQKETYTLSVKTGTGVDNHIEKILGTDTTPGSGLVHIKATNPASAPKQPREGPYDFTKGTAPKATATIHVIDPNSSDTAFTLEAKKAGDGGTCTKVVISESNATEQTFTMTVTWRKEVDIDTNHLDSLLSLQDPDKYIITVTTPKGGTTGFTNIPSAGSFTLNGGKEQQNAVPASVTIPAK